MRRQPLADARPSATQSRLASHLGALEELKRRSDALGPPGAEVRARAPRGGAPHSARAPRQGPPARGGSLVPAPAPGAGAAASGGESGEEEEEEEEGEGGDEAAQMERLAMELRELRAQRDALRAQVRARGAARRVRAGRWCGVT